MNAREIAVALVKKIKAEILALKKTSESSTFSADITIYDTTKGGVMNYVVALGTWQDRKVIAEGLSWYDLSRVIAEIRYELSALKSTKGWSNLDITDATISCGYGWDARNMKYPTTVTLLANPCKEFNSLANYMEKYCGKKLNPFELYSVGIGGKRGRVYGEEGDRRYLCHRPKACERLLAELRKSRATNDKVVTTIKTRDDIDAWELECSIRNEVEFNGYRIKYAEVVIKSPTGRAKATIEVAA